MSDIETTPAPAGTTTTEGDLTSAPKRLLYPALAVLWDGAAVVSVTIAVPTLVCLIFGFLMSERAAGHDDAMWREEFPSMVAWAFGR